MNSDIREALKRSQHHAEQLGKHLRNAEDAHINADDDAVGKHLRAAKRSHDLLTTAHKTLDRAVANVAGAEINPSAAEGAQVSDGYEDRAVTVEDIRQREQRATVDYCYQARMRAEGRRR